MRALDRKLFRDLARMWAQAVTIALVLACGVASYVAMRGAHASILSERDAFYASQRFADVFVRIERAPESAASRIEKIDGVMRVHTRIVKNVLVPIKGAPLPAVGEIVSVPSDGAGENRTPLNAPMLRKGRMVTPGQADEVVLLESFAQAHQLEPGSYLDVVLEGKERRLHVVGLAMSPEYVFAVGAGSFINDPARFGVLWMDRDEVASAFRMEASFNDVVIALQPNASPEAVVAELQRILAQYGVLTAHTRDRQISHHVLDGELQQLSSYAIVAPAIFLTVAAFLINVVLARALSLQRAQIATLKAVGYRDGEIARHYLSLAVIILLGGSVLGLVLGDVLGRGMIGLYQPYFRFPDLAYSLDTSVVATAIVISLAAGLGGSWFAVRRATRIPPAEAMQPESPAMYRRPFLEAIGLPRLFSVAARMIVRELVRKPLRTALSCFAISLATAVVMTGRFSDDAMAVLFELVFDRAQHDDIEVTFYKPVTSDVTREIEKLPGVILAEPRRVVPVRVRVEQRYRDVPLVSRIVFPDRPEDGKSQRRASFRTVPQWPMKDFEPPLGGVAMSKKLAEVLGVEAGATIEMEVLEGDRRVVHAGVASLVDDVFGLALYASPETLRSLIDEEGNMTSVLLLVDRASEDRLLDRLAKLPRVLAISRRDDVIDKFHDQTHYMWVTMMILTLMGATIAFGVIYNQARIALSTRSRDLASLRVLGFTRREISAVLLGELGSYVVLGIPFGWMLGRKLVDLIISTADPESYRMPMFVSLATYAFASTVTLIAAAISALIVRQRLDKLDLVGVLKARD